MNEKMFTMFMLVTMVLFVVFDFVSIFAASAPVFSALYAFSGVVCGLAAYLWFKRYRDLN